MRSKSPEGAESIEVDNTPMLDVIFILLIFFLVTASFTSELGIDLYSPAPHQTTDERQASKVILVAQDGSVRFSSMPVSLTAMEQRVRAYLSGAPDPEVTIITHPQTRIHHVVATLDRVRSAGFETPAIRVSSEQER